MLTSPFRSELSPALDSNAVIKGAAALLDNYVVANCDDIVVVLYTPDSRDQAALILSLAKSRGLAFAAVPMMPLVDEGFELRFFNEVSDAFTRFSSVKIVTLERDTMSHSDVIRGVLRSFSSDRYTVHRIMSASDELLALAFHAPPDQLEATNANLLSRIGKSRHLRIKTPSGSELSVELDCSRYSWISNRGLAKPGAMVVLPAGEVATFPKTISGRFVADFALNINAITTMDVRLRDRPVTLEIERGEVRHIHCMDKVLLDFIVRNLDVPFGRRVGELGFGTHPGVIHPLAHNSHFNERKPGIHLGLGQHNQSKNSEYHCDVHMDFIADGGKIWIDGVAEPLDLLSPPQVEAAHPDDVFEEDVLSPYSVEFDGDCCGVGGCTV